MKNIKVFRVFLAVIFFIAALALLFFPKPLHPMAVVAEKVQIVPSALAATLGATLFWLAATFLFGRVYCSTVCPVGSLADIGTWLRRRCKNRGGSRLTFSYRPPRVWRYHFLAAYLFCLVLGVMSVCFLVEPWNIMRNIASAVNLSATAQTWATLSFGAATGIVAGVVSLVGLLVWGFLQGREFCNTVCPIGTAMGLTSGRTLYHIELDPDKCSGCLACEDVCSSGCIKIVSRYVDNSRCVRCFDCLAACPDDAIHFQINRNRRPATPLLKRKNQAT